ncbi:TPA: hypothetical protein SAN82_001641 [Pseudomonas putida]|nr:hypothetical protein [Pseudomonas putida]
MLGDFTTYGLFFITDSASPFATHALRPLTIFPQAVAYYLDPYSFKYWNLLLALSIVIKGCSISYIGRQLTDSWAWGTIAAILLIVYPADTMQLSFRSLHINWALSLVLLGTVAFLYALSTKTRYKSYFTVILSAFLLASACGMYEASLLLSGLPILVLFAQLGTVSLIRQVRQNIGKHAIWLSGGLIYIAYAIHTANLVSSYQGSIAGNSAVATLKQSFPHLFSIGLLRSTLGGWYDAARITKVEFGTYWYASTVLIVIVGLAGALLSKFPHHDKLSNITNRLTLNTRLLFTGLLLAMLGYAPFLVSPSHQSISQRTFLFASVGGALTCLAILHAIHGFTRKFSGTLVMALAFVGLSSQLYQFHHYVKLSKREQSILQSIVTQFDGKVGDKTLLVLDKTNQINSTWMFINKNLKAALSYTYGHSFDNLEVCHVPSNEWQQSDNIGRKGLCEETANEWVFHYPEPVSGPGIELGPTIEDKHISKTNIITIIVDPDNVDKGSLIHNSVYEKFLNDNKDTLGRIYRGVIAPQSHQNALLSFNDEFPKNSYYWGFGDWWSMDKPIAGSGWREAEWTVNNFRHDAGSWKTNRQGSLLFPFTPTSETYELRAKFDYILPQIRESIKIRVNDTDIPFTWTTDNKLSAQINKNQLKTGINSITFISDVDNKYYGLSAKMTWLEIK